LRIRGPWAVTSKIEWYRRALQGLGLRSLLRLQFQKRFKRRQRMNRLSAKMLMHDVYARPGTSDLSVFDQIFITEDYRCLAQVRAPGLIVDCGANVGYASAYFLSKFPDCFVVAVEPDPGNFAVLTQNLAPYSGRYRAIQAAVWPRTERLRFAKSSSGLGQEWARLVERPPPGAATEAVGEEIATIDLPSLFRLGGRERVSILKIDIEGAELELFSGDVGWIDKVDNIVIELHSEKATQLFYSVVDKGRFVFSTSHELTIGLGRQS
jgi:FkbM family methyltransferase